MRAAEGTPSVVGPFGCRPRGPFTYVKRGKPMAMSYHEAPAGFDDSDLLREWARGAFAAALRAKNPKSLRCC